MKKSFYSYNFEEFSEQMSAQGLNPKTTKIVFDKIYKNKTTNIKSLPENFFDKLDQKYDFALPEIDKVQKAEDGTIKFLVKLEDGLKVECVLIPFFKKYTVCLSSQVGCAMNCSFCYTGLQGLKRHLKAEEIIAQYLLMKKYLHENIDSKSPSPNIVFMGQGEPLHNFDEIKKALSVFLDSRGLHLGPRQITLSTAGYLPGLKKFNELSQINLAISFHSPKNETRNELIPLNKKYPIEILLEEVQNINLLKKQFITLEYLLIDEVNNSEVDAHLLYERLKNGPFIVNLIPFNPIPGINYKRPSKAAVEQFKEYLVSFGIRTMVRTTKGDDILAACGQLNTKSV